MNRSRGACVWVGGCCILWLCVCVCSYLLLEIVYAYVGNMRGTHARAEIIAHVDKNVVFAAVFAVVENDLCKFGHVARRRPPNARHRFGEQRRRRRFVSWAWNLKRINLARSQSESQLERALNDYFAFRRCVVIIYIVYFFV